MILPKMRHSSAVLLTRGEGVELEVFLVERAPELRFFGGFWALPGGVVEGLDRRGETEIKLEISARSALRELFEETGILAGSLAAAVAPKRRAELRAELLSSDAQGSRWWDLAGAVDRAVGDLRLICQFQTPLFAAVRHTTPFFHLHLPLGQEPVIERGELVDGRFFRPEDLVSAWRRGELPVAPPVLYLLGMLRSGDLEDFHRRAKEAGAAVAGGQLHRARFSPGLMLAPLLTDTLPPALTTNAIFVGEERVYLVDPATTDPHEQERLFETMGRWIAAGRKFLGLLLTHHHADHIGAVEATARRFGLAVMAHPETLRRLEFLGAQDGVVLNHGDELDLGHSPDGRGGWRLAVHHTPGHAPGHLVFIENRYRAAIVGDMVSTLSTIVIDPPEGHMATYMASLRYLKDQKIGTLYPAHGPAHIFGDDLLGQYIEHRAEREAQLRLGLERGLATLDELLAVVYSDTPRELHSVARRSLLAGLIKLGEEGHGQALSALESEK
ncbi:MAG TPA: MBL fold metallo-hydrolase [Planctomycetes bacterium]|jgi:glyoxylase-like metal-dependent hydrolase (beta-lactamase superfamily II)/8-oxo-dGTP pyrophosphatase MutT (NUDIX family)|nr:MBL fold metallo-hydrolase [Planctomycetota bacterium]HIL51794.1 MBL fold metallo-hydrolase [Planctomycetota bacterium]